VRRVERLRSSEKNAQKKKNPREKKRKAGSKKARQGVTGKKRVKKVVTRVAVQRHRRQTTGRT